MIWREKWKKPLKKQTPFTIVHAHIEKKNYNPEKSFIVPTKLSVSRLFYPKVPLHLPVPGP